MLSLISISRGVAAACCVLLFVAACPAFATEELLQKADKNLESKNYLKAKEEFREVFIAAKTGALAELALFGIAKSDFLLKNYSESVLNMQRYIASQSAARRDEARIMLGYSYLFLRKYPEAQKAFEAAGGEFAGQSLLGRAELALHAGQVKSADQLLAAVPSSSFDSNRAMFVKALLLAKKGAGSEALSLIDKVSAPALRDEDIRVDKAEIYLLSGRIKESEAFLKSILAAPLSSVEQLRARRILLQAYERQGRTDDMLTIAQDLLSYDTNDEVRRKLIVLFDTKNDLENSLKQIAQLRDKGLRSLEVERRLKKALSEGGPKTLDLLQRFAFHLNAESPVLAEAANYLAKNGKKAEARSLLQKAARSGTPSEASIALADIFIQEGKHDEAKKLLQPLLTTKQHAQSALLLMGEIADKKGDVRGAIDVFEKTAKRGKQPRIESRLGDLYWKTGDKKAALKYYSSAADQGDTAAMVKAADAFYMSGQNKPAEKYYKKALDSKLEDGTQKQWAYYQYGKLAQKREFLEKAAGGGGEIGEAAQMYLYR
ncbi:MAG: tetratricopeptide repeat domain protein [Nitrospirae bacterium]|nr:MAG: tetratricopeptide repeat domain protein [Nitrospirota bacterium]